MNGLEYCKVFGDDLGGVFFSCHSTFPFFMLSHFTVLTG